MLLDLSVVGSVVDGRLWVGEAGKDVKTFPVDVFLDGDFLVAVGQPIWLKNGYVWVGGNVVDLFVRSSDVDVLVERG